MLKIDFAHEEFDQVRDLFSLNELKRVDEFFKIVIVHILLASDACLDFS